MAIEVNLRKDTNQVVQSEKNVASLVGFLRKMVSWFEGKLRAFSERTCLPITENKLRWLFFTILYGHCLWFVSVVLIFPTNIIHGFARAFPPSLSVSLFQLLYGDTAIWNTFLWGLLIFFYFEDFWHRDTYQTGKRSLVWQVGGDEVGSELYTYIYTSQGKGCFTWGTVVGHTTHTWSRLRMHSCENDLYNVLYFLDGILRKLDVLIVQSDLLFPNFCVVMQPSEGYSWYMLHSLCYWALWKCYWGNHKSVRYFSSC